uniref:Uncharacterized protein n=2 Tax=Pseudo-nitzschia australis TaxID=44445 RepID=A0A7S4EMM4_9STRA
MPSRESVPEDFRARTEFIAAVRTGIDVLMGRCGYSRERAINVLLKELNRGPDSMGKPTDDEMFDAMRKYKLGIDEANRAIVVSRAMRRAMFSRRKGSDTDTDTDTDTANNSTQLIRVPPLEAVHRLIAKISLDTILYESGEEDSEDDDYNHNHNQNQSETIKIPRITRVSSSSSVTPSSSISCSTKNSTIINNSTTRKNARNKKLTSPSPRKHHNSRNKSNNNGSSSNNNGNNNNNSSNNNVSILVGKKRGIEEMDVGATNTEVETKAATGRPLRASKRLHRSSSSSSVEPTVNVNVNMNMNMNMNMNANNK